MSASHSSSVYNNSESPSTQIQTLKAILLGYQYGDLEDGRYRRETSSQINEILQEYSSGLLQTTHSTEQVSATTLAIEDLFSSTLIPQLFHWPCLSPTTSQNLCSIFANRAATFLVPVPDTSPIIQSLRSLHVSALVTSHTNTRPTRAALHDAWFVCLRLIPSFSTFSEKFSPADHQLFNIIQQSFPLLEYTNEEHSTEFLNQGLPNGLERRLRAAVTEEVEHMQPATQNELVGMTTIAMSLLHTGKVFGTRETQDGRNSATILAELSCRLIEHSEQTTRVPALEALTQTFHFADPLQTLDAIRGALLWHDPPSISYALLMVRELLQKVCPHPKKPAVGSDPPREWTRMVKELLRIVDACQSERVREGIDDEVARLPSESHLEVAVDVLMIMPDLVRHWMIVISEEFIMILRKVLRKVLILLKANKVKVNVFERIIYTLVDALAWVWCQVQTFDTGLLMDCLEAFLETRKCEDEVRVMVRSLVLVAIEQLAKCGQPGRLKRLLKDLRDVGGGYESLVEVNEFLNDCIELICHVEKKHASMKRGQDIDHVIGKYFPWSV